MGYETFQGIDRFEAACMDIILEQPEAIGVAYKGMDCGCALLCGVSSEGRPLGTLRYLSGQPTPDGRQRPICLQCKIDDGLQHRVVREGIHWPGADHERPEPALRHRIGRLVFGDGYREA